VEWPKLTCGFYYFSQDFTDIIKNIAGTTGQSSQIIAVMRKLTKSLNGSGSASVPGHQSANQDCYNLRQALLVSLSMGLKTCRGPMVLDDLLLRNLEIPKVFPAAIPASIG